MKKIVSSLILIVTLSVLLIGCSGKDNSTAAGSNELRQYNAFISAFEDLVSKLPDYSVLQLSDVPLEDNSVCHTFYIEDSVFDETYWLSVYTNEDSEITWVFLSTERKSYGNLQFAVFSLYAYEAMDFPEVDADSFYEKYDLFSKEKIFESNVYKDYEITSMTIDATNEITFSIKTPSNKE